MYLMEVTKHHPLYAHAEWVALQGNKSLRAKMGSVSLEDGLHQELHDRLPAVPTLPHHTALRVNKLWTPSQSTPGIERAHDFIEAVNEAAHHPKVHHIERDIAYLVMESIALQFPYIAQEIGAEELAA